jgi:DNA-binding NarL/FixJ family response regulator
VPIRVLIVDDHGVIRQGLRMYLWSDREIEIVGEARNGAEAVKLARELHPDVVLMDLLMPVMDGVTATRIIREELPDTEVVALTSVLDDGAIVEAVRAGAIGYLLKDTEAKELIRAITAAAAGKAQLPNSVTMRLVKDLLAAEPTTPSLTEREIAVLRLLARAKSNKQISQELSVSEQTVKTHVSHILKKLGLSSRTQAALYAIQSGVAADQEGPEPPANHSR